MATSGAGAGAAVGAVGGPLPAHSPPGDPLDEEEEDMHSATSPTRMVASSRPLQTPHPDYGVLELFVPYVANWSWGDASKAWSRVPCPCCCAPLLAGACCSGQFT